MNAFIIAANVTLLWNANPVIDAVTGYKLYVGNQAGVYTQTIDVKNVTQYPFVTSDDTQSTYFALTAYNAQGKESLKSAEVVDGKKPSAPTLTLTIP